MSIAELVDSARKSNRFLLTEFESKQVLKEAGINIVDTYLAKSQAGAIAISKQIGYPVVLKIASPDVAHKSDVGGVKVGLKSNADVIRAYRDIMRSVKEKYPGATIDGVSVQKMARQGIEVIIGMSKDPQFGPVLMFGLGGIMVEVLKDVSFRIVPMNKRDAREMVREIKAYPILDGYRGQEPANVPYLEEMILKISDFVDKHPEISEMDINPIFAYRDGAVAVDARIVLEKLTGEKA